MTTEARPTLSRTVSGIKKGVDELGKASSQGAEEGCRHHLAVQLPLFILRALYMAFYMVMKVEKGAG